MRSRRGLGWWLSRLALALLLLLVTLVVYGTFITQRELAQHPPPGSLVDVGGHRLHLNCTGSGAPTVVLEAGSGGWSLDWAYVQPEVARFTRVCTYDRAGLGWSEPGPRPRDAQQAASELHALLGNAGVSPPYVLVGQSLGGHIARLYKARYPAEVRALVLVDPRPEDFDAHAPEYRQSGQSLLNLLRVAGWLSRLGLLNLLGAFIGPPEFVNKLPPEVVPTYLSVGFQSKYFETLLLENEYITQSDAQARSAGALAGVPLVVIARGQPDAPAGLSAQVVERAEAAWRRLLEALAQQSEQGRLVVAERSGHGVMFDQPELIVATVRELVEAAR
ncbi:MAG: alpha/beta fold hydrolase [Chloroflexota bacterium]